MLTAAAPSTHTSPSNASAIFTRVRMRHLLIAITLAWTLCAAVVSLTLLDRLSRTPGLTPDHYARPPVLTAIPDIRQARALSRPGRQPGGNFLSR